MLYRRQRQMCIRDSTRIDLVLTRTAAVKTHEIFMTGMTAKTPDGLWASDHFGVVAVLSIP